MKLSRSIVLFPALALVVTVGCVSSSDAQPDVVAKKTTTTIAGKKKKTVPTSSTVVKGGTAGPTTALSVLQTIPVMNENGAGYSRSLFKHWIDADGDSCNTREEVLIAESKSRAQVDAFGCKVIEGDWFSPYEGQNFTSPSNLDVDHVVPLKEAWDSGASSWTSSRRQAFANDLSDPRSLIAVSASQNRSKGDKDPSNWIPSQSSYLCTYLSDWIAIKARWNLTMDQSEAGRIRNLLNRSCATTTVAPWGASGSTPGETIPAQQPVIAASPTQPGVVSSPPVTTGAPTGQEVNGGKRCKEAEFGQTGTYRGIPYICSNTRQDGSAYKPGYYMWRPQ
jgi:hypothetical protein